MANEGTINISVINGVPFVWEAEACCQLREDHRIVGKLVGCHPRYPRQNSQLSLPLQLMPEEATLLRDKGICELCDDSQPAALPSEQELQDFLSFRKKLYQDQVEVLREEKRKTSLQYREQILAGRKVKRQRMIERKRKAGLEVTEEDLKPALEEDDLDIDTVPIAPLQEKSSLVQICLTKGRQRPCEAADWHYPSTPQEVLRYRTYRELWERGYFITSGARFGGDFLVYPGDPSRYHSFYIAICKPADQPFTTLDLTTFGRMGSNVKKTALMCSLDHEDKVTFTSIQWTGIS